MREETDQQSIYRKKHRTFPPNRVIILYEKPRPVKKPPPPFSNDNWNEVKGKRGESGGLFGVS